MIGDLTPAARLKRRVDFWSRRLGVLPRVVRVQPMRRKWGSCSEKGIVSLASDLDDQDAGFQDFVVVHELLHLRVRNHGRMFKALLAAHIPAWRHHASRAGQPLGPTVSRTRDGAGRGRTFGEKDEESRH